ncbi:hypothetical protein F5Y11DRAFT_331678 [Daldinia sp. FL1419]|nr:hypothetical protein F5Y11DRAFT_331678 [Daldinia sp. FL1419]
MYLQLPRTLFSLSLLSITQGSIWTLNIHNTGGNFRLLGINAVWYPGRPPYNMEILLARFVLVTTRILVLRQQNRWSPTLAT